MKNLRKSLKPLWIIFGLVLLTKALLVFLRNGPFIFPDEGCIIQVAKHYAATFQLEKCGDILNVPLGDAYPLYSILISPIYKFFSGLFAYKSVLVLNSILVSGLVFPLYWILNKYTKNHRYALIGAAITVFLPQFTVYEKTLMTETLYSVLLVWFMFFYIKSFTLNKSATINKVIAVLFGILLSLTRPLGFMLLIAIAINEFIVSKKKGRALLIYLPISVLMAGLAVLFFSKGVAGSVLSNLNAITQAENWKYLFNALSAQINSFTIATFFIPLVMFYSFFFKKNSVEIFKIKYLILVYIGLNFLISANHIFGYTLTMGYSPNLVTRYISSSVILIFIIALVAVQKFKNFKFNLGNTLFMLTLIVFMLFYDAGKFGSSLNMDIMSFLSIDANRFAIDLVPTLEMYRLLLLPVIVGLSLVLLAKNKKLLLGVSIVSIVFFSILSYATLQEYSQPSKLIAGLDEIPKSNIAVIIPVGNTHVLGQYWILKSISKHNIESILIETNMDLVIDKGMFAKWEAFKRADFIISSYKSTLPLHAFTNRLYIYNNQTK